MKKIPIFLWNPHFTKLLQQEKRGIRDRLARRIVGLVSTFLLVFLLSVFVPLQAAALQIDTGLTGKGLNRGDIDPSVTWNYTGDFSDQRFASYVDLDYGGATSCHFVGGNCRTYNNRSYGPDVPGTYPEYNGVQFFYLTFDLPSNAQDVSMHVTNVGADDRVGLSLNTNEIGFWGNVRFTDDPNATQLGRIDGSDRYASTSIGPGVETTRLSGVPFYDPWNQSKNFWLTDPALFLPGDTNVVRLWVNNTGTRNNSAIANRMSYGNPSVVGFNAEINYTLTKPVPEPTTMLLLGTGLIGLAGFRRRSKKK